MTTIISDPIVIRDTAQGTLSLSTSAAQTDPFTEAGIYDIWGTGDCYIKVNGTANDVTVSTGYLLRRGNTVPVFIGAGDRLGGVVGAGTETLSYHKVG